MFVTRSSQLTFIVVKLTRRQLNTRLAFAPVLFLTQGNNVGSHGATCKPLKVSTSKQSDLAKAASTPTKLHVDVGPCQL